MEETYKQYETVVKQKTEEEAKKEVEELLKKKATEMVEGEIENIEITYHIEQDNVIGTATITALE